MAFYVGQKVVCINGTYLDPNWVEIGNKPVLHGVYTVRQVFLWCWPSAGLKPSVLLNEVQNPVLHWASGQLAEHPFPCWRFRPLVERKTDISVFTEMLKPRELVRVID